MTDEIELSKPEQTTELTFEGKRARTSKEQLSKALAPMFAAFPNLEMEADTLNSYHMMLADLDPDKLARAVIHACQTHEYPHQLVTVAAIRKAYREAQGAPGSWQGVDPHTLPDIPRRLFRLDPDEDRKERMDRLRRTQYLDRYYS